LTASEFEPARRANASLARFELRAGPLFPHFATTRSDSETFSDVVLRLAGERSLLELAGILSDEEADALRDAVDERRERRRGELDGIDVETY
jgi:predicted CopG family antitoxin